MGKLLQKWSSSGRNYDLLQTMAGVTLVYRRFAKILAGSSWHNVLDMGGGTGRIRSLFSPECRYYCLDNETSKLLQFRKRTKPALAILGNAAMTPVISGSMDLVLCIAVSHHLTDSDLHKMLLEAMRVLRPGGQLLFFDPVLKPRWWPGRLLWLLDNGSHPRDKDTLLDILSRHIRIVRREEFRLAHAYLLVVGLKGAA